jgi:hypothetical protein
MIPHSCRLSTIITYILSSIKCTNKSNIGLIRRAGLCSILNNVIKQIESKLIRQD